MANRDLDFSPDVTNVTVEDPADSLALGVAGIAAKIADASEQSKVLLNSAQLHVGYKKLDADFRTKWAGDPTNGAALSQLQEDRETLADSMGENISPFYQRQWQGKAAELASQSDASNEVWTVHQQIGNAKANAQTSMQTYLDSANKDGQAFAQAGGTDGSLVMNYLTARQTLEQGLSPVIGAPKTQETLKSFNSDYVKSFVAGAAETNPVIATQLLSDPNIQQHFTTEERGDMVQVINKTQKQQTLQKTLSVTGNNALLPDIVNDPNMTYYEKRAKIDALDMQGWVTSKAASSARRVIKSSDDLDTQTDTPVMSGYINKMYDLNANSQTSGADYLLGVQHLQEGILDDQAAGKLTGRDAGKLNKTLTDLSAKRVGDTTREVGGTFYKANQEFTKYLPPEYRGDATRQLFYKTYGQTYTQEQYVAQAHSIIDSVNAQRRDKATQIATQTSLGDPEFLKTLKGPKGGPATMQDVKDAALKFHVSEAAVIRRLRAGAVGRKSSPKVLGIAPDDSSGDDLGSIPIPAKPSASNTDADDNADEGVE